VRGANFLPAKPTAKWPMNIARKSLLSEVDS
jgi:hypothetical protein